MTGIITHCFRAYCGFALAAAGFTALWALGIVDVALPMIGYAWFAVAAVGTVIAVGMTNRDLAEFDVDSTESQLETFAKSPYTGRPLDMYIGALAMWAAVSFGWVLGGMSASGLSVVGYGWLVIAVYGVLVGAGIVLEHREDVRVAIDPTETLDADG